MTIDAQLCPPHHWLIESREVARQVVDYHRCLRCGLDRSTPRPSPAELLAARATLPRAARAPRMALQRRSPAA